MLRQSLGMFDDIARHLVECDTKLHAGLKDLGEREVDLGKAPRVASCWVPCDHVPVRSWPLFRARQLMRDVIESFKQDQAL